MPTVKFNVKGSDPDKALTGGGEQPPVGMYPAKIQSAVYETPDDKDPRLHVIYELTGKANTKYAALHDYIVFSESSAWKLDQFLQAVGLASKSKRTGEFDPAKLKNKPVKLRVKGETYNEEYRGKPGGVWGPDGDTDEEAGADEDEAAEDQEPSMDEDSWAALGAAIDAEEAKDDAIDQITEAAGEVELDPEEYETWEELGTAIDESGATEEEGSEEGSEEEGEEEASDEEDVPYADWTLADLKAELEARELATNGAKSVLVARLEEDDENAGPFDE